MKSTKDMIERRFEELESMTLTKKGMYVNDKITELRNIVMSIIEKINPTEEKEETFFEWWTRKYRKTKWDGIYASINYFEGKQWADYWLASRIMEYEIEKINDGWMAKRGYPGYYLIYETYGGENPHDWYYDFVSDDTCTKVPLFLYFKEKNERVRESLLHYHFPDGSTKNVLDMYFGVKGE